jgi:hypothetical protein
MDGLLSSLSRRVFIMNNVHGDGPVLFESRWSLSWLRGPLSRTELKALKTVRPATAKNNEVSEPQGRQTITKEVKKGPPMLPPEITVRYAPIRKAIPANSRMVYKPMLLTRAEVRFTDTKSSTDFTRTVTQMTLLKGDTDPINWEKSFTVNVEQSELEHKPAADAEFADLPAPATNSKMYTEWKKDFVAKVLELQKLELHRCPVTKLCSQPDESERDFRIRLMQDTHEERDRQLETMRKRYADKLSPLQDRVLRAEQMLEKEIAESKQVDMQSAINMGATLFGAVMGRKVLSQANIRRASSALNAANRSGRQKQDVEHARDAVEQLNEKIATLELEFRTEMSKLQSRLDPISQQFEKIVISAKKTNVRVLEVSLCWAPCVRQEDGRFTAAW